MVLQQLSVILPFMTTGIDMSGVSPWRSYSTSRPTVSRFRRRHCSHLSWLSSCNRHVLQEFLSVPVVTELEWQETQQNFHQV